MPEHCDHCQTFAPHWDDREYAVWYLGVTADGEYLGVICPSYFASDEIAFMHAQSGKRA